FRPGGTMTTRSTPASSIIGSARSMVNGSGNCGLTPGSQGQSGELAFQKCTWASTIVRLLAGCGRACCASVVSAAPATSVVPMNLLRVSVMLLPDGAAFGQRFVGEILQPGHGKAQPRSSPLCPLGGQKSTGKNRAGSAVPPLLPKKAPPPHVTRQ